ncbi:MFS transporter [Curtobacterium sp. SORGH_AS_0776]|uniref:MFS transporter n=1 Tax=Curtobacterium sp. SORGH_AS_0776 TaxID=3041798 RepID=UPI00285CF749|nr:MFS transporter [Curtobacterium sp. SORGH_AS_0776]MDR6170393.1 putative MFS family arabinose efflux permease [Curtobacterium sp. SORGH_AS_0776]
MSQNHLAPRGRRPLAAVFAIALGSFSVVVAEFVPVGALSAIAHGLRVSEGEAGLLVTLPAVVGAVAAPVATVLMRRLDRRVAVQVLTALIAVSCLLSAVAPTFGVMLLGRLLLGVSVGGVWATAVSAAARLVPERIVHTASSMVFGAIAVGSVITVPSATLAVAHVDWRWTFAGAAAVAVFAVVMQLVLVPRIPAADRVTGADFRTILTSAPAVALLAIVLFVVFGQFSAFTFVVPYLVSVAGLSAATASLLLFVYGVLTIVGNFGGGALLGRSIRGTVVATLVAGGVGLLLLALGASAVVAVVVALVLWGLSWGNAPVALQHWLFTFDGKRFSAEAVNASFTAVVQVGVAAGSFLAGLAVDAVGTSSSVQLGAASALVALVIGLVLMAATARRYRVSVETR